ncbi:4-hydroxy-3-methylbut-2-enyl diphosphate reductase [uncultured Desulfuromonas sp.]|uniref:4-hydroxy-3-methylbut-2-enyl diphosphate reductase n=1 Tax=uncultured Desulfuromonas sp. TaxID=181013 RepID=UPI002AAAA056|nr:4-hydroxy-3-methylbut-2-enyl diphosphate reductase [uncultured Desulfuromonas sp.]
MEIILAKSAGFCFGVKRAVNMAFRAAENSEHICSLGPLIHSPQLVQRLEGKGIRVQDSVEKIVDETVIIRSHGITRNEELALERKGLSVVDATCPFVKKAQQYAALLGEEGYSVVIVGEQEHPEVQGIISYAAGSETWVVANPEEARTIPPHKKLGLVAQTTQSFDNFSEIVQELLENSKELRIFNTICDATAVRQEEARQIAGCVDLMVVIGGHNSANTTRLARISSEIQPRTFHIETTEEIIPSWLDDVETVGVTAGASTPEWIIRDVVDRLAAGAK